MIPMPYSTSEERTIAFEQSRNDNPRNHHLGCEHSIDIYGHCSHGDNAALVSELLGGDGPYSSGWGDMKEIRRAAGLDREEKSILQRLREAI